MVSIRALAGRAGLAGLIALCGASLPAAAQQLGDASLPSAPESQQIEGIAAIVNDAPISFSDVRERAQLLLLSLGSQPTQQDIQRITGQALQQLIDEKLQLQEAAEYEVEVAEADINAAIEDMAAQSGIDRQSLVNQLLSAGINPASLEEQMRAEIAWRRLMSGLYGSRIRISENQIDEQMQRLKASASETQYLVSEIFLFAPDAQSQSQAREAANSIRAQIAEGAPFQIAAQRFSSAPTAATGGDMGWISLDDLDPALADAVMAMDGPGISEPITVENGIYLIALRNRREPQTSVTMLTLMRLFDADGDRQRLLEAAASVEDCDGVDAAAEGSDALSAASLGRIALNELAPDAAARLEATPVGGATEPFESGEGLAVMFVCERNDSVDNLPSPEQIENRLFGQQLTMISERALRNLRREATIIRRDS